MNKSFCVFPWTHLFVDSMGHFYNCCLGPAGKPSFDDNGSPILASEKGSIKRHWHSQYMRSLRTSMNEDTRHEACNPCWRVEDVKGQSYRELANMSYNMDENFQTNILPEPSFEFVDLRFGNMCNLACRMCLPYSTRKLIPEYREHFGEDFVKPYLKQDWFESDDFWDELFLYSSKMKRIHVAGGEPLLIKQCWKFLKRLVDAGLSQNLTLTYNTNMTIVPEEAKEIWKHFGRVDIIASMDGVGKINEFIRYPLNWESFEKNLKDIDSHFQDYNIASMEIHATAQVYNIKRIEELCDYVANTFTNIKKIPTFDIVYGPVEFDPQILPAFYREEAAQLIDNYIDKLLKGHNNLTPVLSAQLIKNIQSIANHLRSGDKTQHFHEFKRLNDVFDRNRKHRTFDFIPELERAY